MCHKQVHCNQVHLQLYTKARHALLSTVTGFVEAEVGRALSTGRGRGTSSKCQLLASDTLPALSSHCVEEKAV